MNEALEERKAQRKALADAVAARGSQKAQTSRERQRVLARALDGQGRLTREEMVLRSGLDLREIELALTAMLGLLRVGSTGSRCGVVARYWLTNTGRKELLS